MFGSFQDYLGKNTLGGIKAKNEWVHTVNWDLIVEPTLFERVTGLTQADFDLLRRIGVFNQANMNNAIVQFRRYEDTSLEYTGVSRHASKRIGLFDSSITIEAIVKNKTGKNH